MKRLRRKDSVSSISWSENGFLRHTCAPAELTAAVGNVRVSVVEV